MEMVEGGSGKMNSSPLVMVWMVRVREEAVRVSISRMVALGETNYTQLKRREERFEQVESEQRKRHALKLCC